MTIKIKFIILIILIVIGCALSISMIEFRNKSILLMKQSELDLKKYTKIGDANNLNRKVEFPREATLSNTNGSTSQKNAHSDISTSIYMEVKERTGNKQKIRMYARIHNTSWLNRIVVNGPDIVLLEQFIEQPTSEQIKKMTALTKNQTMGVRGAVFWPREIHLATADFELPFPANLNYEVVTIFFENLLDKKNAKSIHDSIFLDANFINKLSVVNNQ